MRTYVTFAFAFLYLPILLIVAFSFNSGHHATDFQGFSVAWYGKALNNPFVLGALGNSLIIAAITAILSAVLGTTAALALERVGGWPRAVFDGMIYVAIMVPGVVIGISTLVTLVNTFDAVNTVLDSVWPETWGDVPQAGLGYGSVIAAHTLYTLSLVVVVVRARIAGMDRSLIEASSDLYATPLQTFTQITLPQLLPAVLAGFLLSFTFSFDDFIIAFFVAGPNTTLPIYVFSSIRRGVTPEINAIGTMILVSSLVLLFAAQFMLHANRLRRRQDD